jgi:hypothetical protein
MTWCAGMQRPRLVWVGLTGVTFSIQLKLKLRHVSERPIRLCKKHRSRMGSKIGAFRQNSRLNWEFISTVCDEIHKLDPRNPLFTSMDANEYRFISLSQFSGESAVITHVEGISWSLPHRTPADA